MITVFSTTDGSPSQRASGTYTGELWRDAPTTDEHGVTVGNVFFTPCARTHWHSHPGGQLLIIEHGEGFVGDRERATRVVAGDIVWTPPNVEHWHGATSERSMMHTAVTFGGVTWGDPVSGDQYAAGNEADPSRA